MSNIHDEFKQVDIRIKKIEERLGKMLYDMRSVAQSEFNDRIKIQSQAETQFGVYSALVVDTVDIWKQNRVRFFCPLYHDPKKPIKTLPWAFPVSSMGGFDDSGLCWPPPAGSTILIIFEAGKRDVPYYLGTTWHRNRGPEGNTNWGYNIEEYFQVSAGHRKGYLAGPNNESQVLPPWNTESYNGFDINSVVDFNENPEAQKRITYPNIYGFKTPEKHMVKMVDGDAKCNRKWKRFEILSSCGNWMLFKDDHLHYSGQWAHPTCSDTPGDTSCVQGVSNPAVGSPEDETLFEGLGGEEVLDEVLDSLVPDPNSGERSEFTDCIGTTSNPRVVGGHPRTPQGTKYSGSQIGANPFFKHENECRPYKGVGTPQNNKAALPQSGIQFMSISGHTWYFDDSVEEPSGNPTWERSTEDFDFGCNDKFLGKAVMQSATGHIIEMNDREQNTNLRHEDNGINLITALGNSIKMSDHTIAGSQKRGGEKRGITMQSTSRHKLEMIDNLNEQVIKDRQSGSVPDNKAKAAFIRLRSGYGLQLEMNDQNDQNATVAQYVQLLSPQTDNTERGAHFIRMQENPAGPGLILVRAGGNYIVSSYDNMYEVIGDEENNPSDKVEFVTNRRIVTVIDNNIVKTQKSHWFIADDKIILSAGQDCTNPDFDEEVEGSEQCSPCIGPVLVWINNRIRISDRVYASSSKEAACASIFQMHPLIECDQSPDSNC